MALMLVAIVLLVAAAVLLSRSGAVSAGFAPLPADTGPEPTPADVYGSGNPYDPNSPCWEVWEAARAAGFTTERARVMVAIAQAESGCDPAATCDSCGGVREYSVGVFQLNLLAHPQISEADARDTWAAARWAYQLSRGGTDFRPWSTYTGGLYRRYVVA